MKLEIYFLQDKHQSNAKFLPRKAYKYLPREVHVFAGYFFKHFSTTANHSPRNFWTNSTKLRVKITPCWL